MSWKSGQVIVVGVVAAGVSPLETRIVWGPGQWEGGAASALVTRQGVEINRHRR